MFNKDLTEEYKNKKMPDDLKSNILENMQNAKSPKKYNFSNLSIKRRILIYAAVFISLIVVVSAAAIVYNNTRYIPLKGFVEGDYEIYSIPEVLPLGKATIETVTRVKNGNINNLSIIILDLYNDNIKIITEKYGEFNISSGTQYGLNNYGYYIEDFPEINEFTIISGDKSTEVKLELRNPDDVIVVEDDNVTMKFYSMSKGSKIIAYDVSENVFDIEKILGIPEVIPEPYFNINNILSGFRIPDNSMFAYKNISLHRGIKINDYDNYSIYGHGPLMFIDKLSNDTLNKITITRIHVGVYIDNPNNIYADVYIPVPADGEEIVFDDGLVIYDHNGLTSKVTSVIRERNELTIITEDNYTGEGCENMDLLQISWVLNDAYSTRGYNKFKIEDGIEQVLVSMSVVSYDITGNWEIDFN